MNRVFILDKICLNVDNETDVQNLINQGAREVTDLSIFKGYENLVSPQNTVVNDDGSITFTAPIKTQEEQTLSETEQAMTTTSNRIAEIKDELITAVLLDDTETMTALKSEYKELMEDA